MVPDRLWSDPDLTDAERRLWSYLEFCRGEKQEFGYGEIRSAVGICQNSLLKHLARLEIAGWLRHRKNGLRRVAIETGIPGDGVRRRLSTELLLDRGIACSAAWVWHVIQQHGGAPFNYQELQAWTGYPQPALSRYLKQLRAAGWLTGTDRRNGYLTAFHLTVSNPFEAKRQADIEEIDKGMEAARNRDGYSAGQYLLARMVKHRLAKGTVVENAEVAGLDNLLTGGRMHYDILIPEYKIALEFHGSQHFGPTERFPDPEAHRAQRLRDLVKRGLSQEQGTTLLVLTAADLRFSRLDRVLADHVPLKEEDGDQWHIREYLVRLAAQYRRKAALDRRPS